MIKYSMLTLAILGATLASASADVAWNDHSSRLQAGRSIYVDRAVRSVRQMPDPIYDWTGEDAKQTLTGGPSGGLSDRN